MYAKDLKPEKLTRVKVPQTYGGALSVAGFGEEFSGAGLFQKRRVIGGFE